MRFNEDYWKSAMNIVAQLVDLDPTLKENIEHDNLFMLAAALPFLSGSPFWQREGICNLLLIVSISIPGRLKQIYTHCEVDNKEILSRLMILVHDTGIKQIQLRGLALMAIVMINDYLQDQDRDRSIGKYNPISDGSWDYSTERQKLIAIVKSSFCPDMDEIFSLEQALIRTFWLD